jgi:cytochrome P450
MLYLVGITLLIAAAGFLYKYYFSLLSERAHFAKQGVKMTPFVFWYGDQKATKQYAKEGRQQMQDGDLRDSLGAKTYMMSFGPINRLNVLDTNMLREVFKNKDKFFSKSPMTAALLEPLLGMRGLFLLENPHHKKYRGMINPAFHFQKLNVMTQVMIKTCQRQYPIWKENALKAIAENKASSEEGWTMLEMHEAFNSLGLEVVVGTVLGANFDDKETHMVMYNTFNTLVAAILKRFINMTSVLPIIRDLPLASKKFVDAGVARARKVVLKIINERKEGKSTAICEGEDLLDILLKTKDEQGQGLSQELILDQVMTFVFAGHEPTANLLTWAMWCLTHHPETLKKCQDELDTVLKGAPPNNETIKELKYLTAFLNEVLRMYPPAPFIRRKAKEDIECGAGDTPKIHIPKGTEIFTNFFAIHRDPDYWRNPDTFRPERFMETPSEPGVRKAFYPFGLGARVCIGQSFAMLESKIMLAMFLQNFDLKLVPGQTFEVDMKITMHPRRGVHCWIKPRDVPEAYFNSQDMVESKD